jgi:hypothetical protein
VEMKKNLIKDKVAKEIKEKLKRNIQKKKKG